MAPAGARAARSTRLNSVAASARAVGETAWRHRRDPQAQWLAVLALAFLAAAVAFGHLVEDYLTGDAITRWDVEFARWLHEHSTPWLVDVFDVVTTAGNALTLALVTAVAVAVLLRRRLYRYAALLAAAAVGIQLLNALLKLAFHRPRPELAFVHLDTYSFPSGHASGSAATYTLLAVLLGRIVGRRGRTLLGLGTVVLVAAIGFSRLYLGAHYLSDVLAGLALGLAWAAGCLLAFEILRLRPFSRSVPGRDGEALP